MRVDKTWVCGKRPLCLGDRVVEVPQRQKRGGKSRAERRRRNIERCTTTVQVVRLATDPRCLVEINAVAVID